MECRPTTARAGHRLAAVTLYVLIGVLGLLLAVGVRAQTALSLEQATHNYRLESHDEALQSVEKINGIFRQMYQGVRTIARLPGVRSIDRYGRNFGADSRATVQEIYNNLYANVAVSELYIVPVDLEPEELDPNTGELQRPITTFDEFIVGRNADQGADDAGEETVELEEVEIHEYRLMKKQLAWMRERFPDESHVAGLGFPAISGPTVVTCDNSRYAPSNPVERDRSGLVYSVPFYGVDGALRGCISAVVLNPVMREALPGDEFVILHEKHGVRFEPTSEGRWLDSRAHVDAAEPDPSLAYSEVLPLTAVEGVGEWKLWVGFDDDRFRSRLDVRAARRSELVGYLITTIITISLAAIAWLSMRHYRTIRTFVGRLEHQVLERTGELESKAEQLKAEVVERTRSETFISDQNRVLERLAGEQPIGSVLGILAEAVERYQPGILCSIQLMDDDGRHLRHGAAPSLPAEYSRRIDGLEIGPSVGSCGTAAHTAKRVIVEDIAGDPRWEPYRELAVEHDLRACWSQPILAPDGSVVGTLALYYREPRRPVDSELRLVEGAARLAAVAIGRKRAERERDEMHRALMNASRQAGMAEVATGVLHNVGNSLNSVNTAADEAARQVRALPLGDLVEVSALVDRHAGDLSTFVVEDDQGRLLPAFLRQFSAHLVQEQTQILHELDTLEKYVEHIKQVVSIQQRHARTSEVIETTSLIDIIEEALGISANSLERHSVAVQREFLAEPVISTDQHQLVQILVNLVNNAKQAMADAPVHDRRVTIGVALDDGDRVRIEVADTGCGIRADHMLLIFEHGFTTRSDGHGFGLHTASLSARQLHGSLTAHSDGSGCGARFVLELPLRWPVRLEEAA